METTRPLRFIVLIPHRESARIVGEYRCRLFMEGVPGAYSFPIAAPLALVSKPFTVDELKETARALRVLSLPNDGKIISNESACIQWPSLAGDPSFLSEEMEKSPVFFGPLLNLPWESESNAGNAKVKYRFPKLVLCAALLGSETRDTVELAEAPALSFRAGMIANLSIRPLESGEKPYSFEWKLSAPVWLPNVRKMSKGK